MLLRASQPKFLPNIGSSFILKGKADKLRNFSVEYGIEQEELFLPIERNKKSSTFPFSMLWRVNIFGFAQWWSNKADGKNHSVDMLYRKQFDWNDSKKIIQNTTPYQLGLVVFDVRAHSKRTEEATTTLTSCLSHEANPMPFRLLVEWSIEESTLEEFDSTQVTMEDLVTRFRDRLRCRNPCNGQIDLRVSFTISEGRFRSSIAIPEIVVIAGILSNI